MNNNHPWIGKTIGGCRIDKLIGRGGMGFVYMAHQFKLDRMVAVKLLPIKTIMASESEKRNIVGRFQREARLAGQLQHPNAVQIYDVGNDGNLYYIVMQYIEGVDLKQLFKRDGCFSVENCIHMLVEVSKALIAAHDKKIIHRDIKPANIMKQDDNSIVVTDFGLAKPLHVASDLSTPGKMIGTVGFMSPEQAQGGEVDCKTDIYSLGATAFYLLSGRLPFDAKTPVQLIYKQVREEAPKIGQFRPDVPASLSDILQKTMQRDREKRHTSARQLLEEVEKIGVRASVPHRVVFQSPKKKTIPRERQATQLLNMSLLSGENQLGHRVQRYLGLKEINPCCGKECGKEWNIGQIINCKAVLFKKQVWCPQCLWEQFTRSLAGAKVGEIEAGSFGNYQLAIEGENEFIPGKLIKIYYCFPQKSNKKGWDKMLQRIERGGELVSKIRSNTLVRVGKYMQMPDQQLAYIPLEYSPSITLANLQEVLDRDGKRLTLKESLTILRKLAQGLAVLHSNYLVHRNISPKSIFINLNGGVRVGNFTMSKSLETDLEKNDITRQMFPLSEYLIEEDCAPRSASSVPGSITTNLKSVVGTLAFMAPEQTLGAYNVDYRSDLWSWGVIAYGLLEGTPLFTDKNPLEMVMEIREREIPKMSDHVSAPLQKIVYHALERNLSNRFQSAGEIKRSLDLLKLPQR